MWRRPQLTGSTVRMCHPQMRSARDGDDGDDGDDTAGVDALIAIIDAEAKVKPAQKRRLPRFCAPLSDACRSNNAPVAPSLPMLTVPANILYSRSEGETDELCGALMDRVAAGTLSLVGFDIEWRVTYEKDRAQRAVALVQLACESTVYLFHIAAMRRFPERLAMLIEDGRLLKTGCKIGNDMLKLQRDFGLMAAGVLEQHAMAAAALRYGQRPWSLGELCEEVLRHQLPKPSVRLGDWEASCLDEEQRDYAAKDAWASRMIGLDLLRRLRLLPTGPPTHQFVHCIDPDPMWSRRAAGRQWLQRRGHEHDTDASPSVTERPADT